VIRWDQAHIDVGLTNFSKRLKNAQFRCRELLPTVSVKKDSDKYWIYGEENFKITDAFRADKSESGEVSWSMSSTTYNCGAYGLHVPVSQRDRSNADTGISIEQDATMFVKEKVDLSIEKNLADALTSTSNITNYTTFAGGGTDWDGYWDKTNDANSQPLEAISYAVDQVRSNSLLVPNTLAMSWGSWRYFKRHPQVKDLLKNQYGREYIEGSAVPEEIDGLRLVLILGAYDASKSGQDRSSFTDIWGDSVLVAHIDPNPRWGSHTLGVTFSSNGPVVRKWHDNAKNCDIIEYEEQGLDPVFIDGNCGYLLTNVLSSV
jgi:hypothetical protein